MYTCGPSIYQLPHIGNYRTFLFEDVLVRYLEYLGYNVERALNLTDVEDKAIAQAEKEEIILKELTEKNAEIFLEELKKLGAKPPTHIPKSSTCVNQAVKIIEILLKKGYAYWYKGNVYYDPLKFKGFGKLSRLDMTKWPKEKKRFHKDTYPGNVWNRGDFILWHGYREGDKVYWNTSIGRGRPAWNVQDPAMAIQTLGSKVDVYCGGIDNLVRHHDYVIAVAEGVTGEQFARYWLHGEHLYVDGKKMSKSIGNIIYPKDLVERGCQWQHMRFFLINGYYRKRLNFTSKKFKKACDRLHEFKNMVDKIQSSKKVALRNSDKKTKNLIAKLKLVFEEKMNDDLHVKDAFDALFQTVSTLSSLAEKGKVSTDDAEEIVADLKSIDQVLQVIF